MPLMAGSRVRLRTLSFQAVVECFPKLTLWNHGLQVLVCYTTLDHYGPPKAASHNPKPNRSIVKNGVWLPTPMGKALTNACLTCTERGLCLSVMVVESILKGMVIGMHNVTNDLTVNALKGKQLTNVRASRYWPEAQSLYTGYSRP